MGQYCVFIDRDSITPITGTQTSGGLWPGSLVASPRTFQYNAITYNLNQEGIYKFSVPSQNTTNMVIYDSDVASLIASLTYFIVPGQTDEGKTISQLNSKSLSSRINVLCSTACSWVAALLNSKGFSTRYVRCLRADTPNNFYDGHVMLEVHIAGQWKLFDVQLGFSFNAPLKDIAPVNNTSVFNSMHVFKLYNPAEPMINNVYDHANTIDMFMPNLDMLKEWQKNIMQIPGIVFSDGKTYFYMPSGTESRQSWVQSLDSNYVVVPYSTWVNMFY